MTDSADNYSENVKMSLEETQEGQYILKIVPDEEWMNDPDRSYPVTIDPTLEKSTADSNDFVIRDVYVVEGRFQYILSIWKYHSIYRTWGFSRCTDT